MKGRVFALVGNVHPLKKVVWESDINGQPLGERLVSAGLPVISAMQRWSSIGHLGGLLIDIDEEHT